MTPTHINIIINDAMNTLNINGHLLWTILSSVFEKFNAAQRTNGANIHIIIVIAIMKYRTAIIQIYLSQFVSCISFNPS